MGNHARIGTSIRLRIDDKPIQAAADHMVESIDELRTLILPMLQTR
jgi:hypothetical protein